MGGVISQHILDRARVSARAALVASCGGADGLLSFCARGSVQRARAWRFFVSLGSQLWGGLADLTVSAIGGMSPSPPFCCLFLGSVAVSGRVGGASSPSSSTMSFCLFCCSLGWGGVGVVVVRWCWILILLFGRGGTVGLFVLDFFLWVSS